MVSDVTYFDLVSIRFSGPAQAQQQLSKDSRAERKLKSLKSFFFLKYSLCDWWKLDYTLFKKMGEIVSPSPALSNLSIGSTIQCKILHVSSEMIVATYETEEKKTYQGALLFTQW